MTGKTQIPPSSLARDSGRGSVTAERSRGGLRGHPSLGVYAVLAVQSVIASGTHIVAKMIVREMDGFTLTLVRSVISAVVMAAILVAPALLYATTPILVLIFSRLFLGEPLTRRKTVGVVLGFIGVMTVIFERGISASMEYLLGNLLIGCAVVAWGLYTVFGKRLIVRFGAVEASSLTLIIGTVMFIPIGIVPALRFPYETLSVSSWGQILYLAVMTSVFSYFLWYFALGRVEAGKVAIFSNLQPIITTILAVTLLGQEVTVGFVLGGVIALAGVVLAQYG